MCSINGMIDFHNPAAVRQEAVLRAGRTLLHRGPDGTGSYFDTGVGFCHNRLAVMDPEGGAQPMQRRFMGKDYVIVYNGEIYNAPELRAALTRMGAVFTTACDTEAVLWSYIFYKEDCVQHLNGIFAFAVFDKARQQVFLARDRLGVKPLFFATHGSTFFFASEPKALLVHKEIPAEIDRKGLWQLLLLAPSTLPGSGVFSRIKELLPAAAAVVDGNGLRTFTYWRLEAKECTDSKEEAAHTVRTLLEDAVKRQLQSDVPLGVLLSGGLDSSAITALAARHLQGEGIKLSSYSFEYEGNKESFHSSLFQPQRDDEYATFLAKHLGTDHTVLVADTDSVAGSLFAATKARDLPGQADIDSSLLYYCSRIKERHTVILSGECADEIFGGYPWFYRPEMLQRDFFPWLHDPTARIDLFDPALIRREDALEFLHESFKESLAGCPTVEGESESMRTSRLATHLSTGLFMTNLLARKDRMSMHSAVEVRVPFADHRILEYVFNVPWEIKYGNGVEKSLLRHAMEGILPPEILWRKKSPYPKTHHPQYEATVRRMLTERLKRREGFLATALDRGRLATLLEGENTTWFGQLMARPQLIAWLCQLDDWFSLHHVQLNL